MSVKKVTQLIALALDPSVTHEEARSAAFAAVKIIAQYNLLDLSNGTQYEEPQQVYIRSRQEIKELAEMKTDRYIAYLAKKAAVGEFPCLTARWIATKTLKNQEILEDEFLLFQQMLQQALYIRVVRGKLRSKPGRGGGYYLAQT